MFKDVFDTYDWEEVQGRILSKAPADVELALNKTSKRSLDDFMALVSPAAEKYLEQMAQLSHSLTQKRFGKTIQLYAPMYLSNECSNVCTYCGFSFDNKIPRKTLNDDEILEEVAVIRQMGYDHVLLVTGEDNNNVGVDYLEHAIALIRVHFAHISIEVQPLEEDEYVRLAALGLNTVLVYQETYHEGNYRLYHPKGKKSNFEYRLDTPDRLGKAEVHKIGLGVLLGLEDWRADSFFCALHLDHLEKNYWKTKYSISFPRLRPYSTEGKTQDQNIFNPKEIITDRELVQLICAYRIFNEEIELSVSTRESETFRNNIIRLGATTLSAGSKTNPGGYSAAEDSLEQFEISDERTPKEVAEMIAAQGYEPVWKDWDRSYQ